MKDYINAAMSTKSGKFHGNMVGYFYFVNALKAVIDATNHLDTIKKTLFYGKPLPGIEPNHNWGVDLAPIADVINPDIIHAIVGGATETGEMCEALLKALENIGNGTATGIDETNLKEEGGDQLWYLAMLFDALGTCFGDEAKRNIAKLMLRYPDGFSMENALVRDITAERKLLESEVA